MVTKVAIIQRYIPQYRRDFFNSLRWALAEKKIELKLIYGQPGQHDSMKNDAIDLDWALKVPSKIWRVGRFELYWQPILPYLRSIDLVIVEQASKLLVNYALLIQSSLGIRRLAFWGHGKNFQGTSANRLGEWLKRQTSTRVQWWFAYTQVSERVVRDMGFPVGRVTVVQNAVDTHFLHQTFKKLTPEQVDQTRQQLDLRSQHVGIYTGGMYPEKRLPFLLESLQLVRQQISDFEMIFIGAGVDAHLVKQAAARYPWIHFVGSKFDQEKVPYYAVSKLFLMPGLVGLGILDTFALETPLVTTRTPFHSPEIGYLENGVNGIMVEDSNNPRSYATTVAHLLTDPLIYDQLVAGCRRSSEKYTLENMVKNFAHGVERALSA